MSLTKRTIFKHQSDARLDKTSPVQNEWYTVLDTTKNVRIISLSMAILTTSETIAMRLTIDGVVISGSKTSATAGQRYNLVLSSDPAISNELEFSSTVPTVPWGFLVEGRSVKVEIRKTTAVGSGNLQGKVVYGKM